MGLRWGIDKAPYTDFLIEMTNLNPHAFFSWIICSLVSVVPSGEGFAGLKTLSHAIEFPADGGPGPVIWYETARLPNLGSGADTLVLTSQGAMTDKRADFFGSSEAAFGLAADQTQGAAIAGSGDTPYLSGEKATVVVMFQTPSEIAANGSILGRRPAGSNAGEPKFEVYLLSNGTLRITTGETQFGVNTNIGTLAEDTWYFLAVVWDLGLPDNQVSWYLGEMGESTLSRGFIDNVSVVGDPNNAIRVAGRPTFDLFFGSYQNIAIYGRPLGEKAIKDQFLRTAEFRITYLAFQPDASPNTTLRWMDLSTAYQVVATNELPFGSGSDLVIQVDSSNGVIDIESYPDEVMFSFADPGATGSTRFWRVRVDLDEPSIRDIELGGQIVLAEGMEGAAIEGTLMVAGYEFGNDDGGNSGDVEVRYQWYRSDDPETGYDAIVGATAETYTAA